MNDVPEAPPASTPAGKAVGDHSPSEVRSSKFGRWFWRKSEAAALFRELDQRSPHVNEAIIKAQENLAAAWAIRDTAKDGSQRKLRASHCRKAISEGLSALGEDNLHALSSKAKFQLPPEVFDDASDVYARFGAFDSDELAQSEPSEREVQLLEQLAEWVTILADFPARELDDLKLGRTLRGIVVACVVLMCLGMFLGKRHAMRVADETRFPWRTSSVYGREKGCSSPQQKCEEVRFFFCTNEQQNPWIEFDLGENFQVSRVKIDNRIDCTGCSRRAAPLIVEVSHDKTTWIEVAKRERPFDEWDAKFPKQKARWIRLRVPRRTYFHLKQVRIS
jgi:hypothetical protein